MKKYFAFSVIEDDVGNLLPHPGMAMFHDSIDDIDTELYYVKTEDYPDMFYGEYRKDPDGGEPIEYNVVNMLFEGWRSYPKYKLNLEMYNRGEKCFEKFDPYTSEYLKKAYRRKKINKKIDSQLHYSTEYKKIRKALKAIINMLPEVHDLPEIQEFLVYDGTINSIIGLEPKGKTRNYDLAKINKGEDK